MITLQDHLLQLATLNETAARGRASVERTLRGCKPRGFRRRFRQLGRLGNHEVKLLIEVERRDPDTGMPYREPQTVVVRASRLTAVGDAVDHARRKAKFCEALATEETLRRKKQERRRLSILPVALKGPRKTATTLLQVRGGR